MTLNPPAMGVPPLPRTPPMWFSAQETYVSDVASAGAEPVRFDDFCGRWEEVMKEAGWSWRGGLEVLQYVYEV